MKTALLSLTVGLLASTGFTQAPATTTTNTTTTTASPAVKSDVGVSSRDGITISGTDVIVTRNGSSEKLGKDMELSNGTRVMPDGSITARDGAKMTLRPSQVLGFDGQIINAPIVESVAPKSPAVLVPLTPAAAPNAAPSPAQPQTGNKTSNAPIRAGEGVQK